MSSLNLSILNKKLTLFLSNTKNIFINEKYSKIYQHYLFFKGKSVSLHLFKEFDWLNFFKYDRSIIKFSAHRVNANKLILFMINFHDNIVRDISASVHKSYNISNSYVNKWYTRDLNIIINKLKKTLSYFFYFIEYFSVSALSLFFLSYNYFKSAFSTKLFVSSVASFFFKKHPRLYKKIPNLDYLLLNKTINKNYLIRYSNNVWFQKAYKKAYKQNKTSYITFLKNLKTNKLHYFKKKLLFSILLKLRHVANPYVLINSYASVNFFELSVFYFKRSCYYQKFLVNVIYFFSKSQKNKNFFKKIIYIKNFSYFNSSASSKFYNKFHVSNWDECIMNIFNFKVINSTFKSHIKAKYQLYQDNYFSQLMWSWHLVFLKHESLRANSFKFLSPCGLTENTNYLLFKINRLRTTLNYILFLMLPLNFNLVWPEIISQSKGMFRSNTLDIISKKINKKNWFFKNNGFFAKIKKFIISKLNYKKKTLSLLLRKNVIRHLAKTTISSKKLLFQKFFFFINSSALNKISSGPLTVSFVKSRHLAFSPFKFFFNPLARLSLTKQKQFYRFPLFRSRKPDNFKIATLFRKTNAYFDKLNTDRFKKINSCLRFNNTKALSVKKVISNNNFLKKNNYTCRHNRSRSVSLFNVISSASILPLKLISNITLPSKYYQNVILYSVVKNKELLHQVSHLYEFEALMCDSKLRVYFNKLKKSYGRLFYLYNSVCLTISNFYINMELYKKMWLLSYNLSYSQLDMSRLYFLKQTMRAKTLLFV